MKRLSSHLTDRWLARYKGELDKEFETCRDKLEQKRKRSRPIDVLVFSFCPPQKLHPIPDTLQFLRPNPRNLP